MTSRRAALLGLGQLALIGMSIRPAAAIARARAFEPSGDSLRLTRTLLRELSDGNTVTVTRSWAIRLEAQGRGFSVHGAQLSASVSAPDSLAAFARLEQARVEEDQFPIMLDDAGRILGAGTMRAPQQLDSAISLATRTVAALPANRRPDAYLRELSGSAGSLLSRMPDDLFNPRPLTWTMQRSIPLPGGGSGQVEVSFAAEMNRSVGAVGRATREVLTSIADSHRIARESWTLDPM